MSFVRAPFRNFVNNQLNTRTKLLEPKYRSDDWYHHYLSKTAFIRVAPLVNIKDEKITKPLKNAKGRTEFSKYFVLEGAPLKYNKSSIIVKDKKDKDKEVDTSTFSKMPQFPSQLTHRNNDSLLNNPILRTSPDSDGFGIIPPPGITGMKLKTKSFYGNLRECNFTIRCFSIKQFEVIDNCVY